MAKDDNSRNGNGVSTIGAMIAGSGAGVQWGTPVGFLVFGLAMVIIGVCDRLASREVRPCEGREIRL